MAQKIKNTEIKRKLNLKNDIIFKAFFSRKGNEKYLIDFLNAILKIEITSIQVKEEVNLEQLSTTEKGGRLDIQAILNDGMIVNIEMQMRNLNNIEQRDDIYEAKTISRHFPRGEDYERAEEIVSIYILNYNLFGFNEYILDTIKVLNKHRDYQVNSISKEYYIQLPKFRESNPDMNDKLNQWLAIIDDQDRGKIEMAKSKNKIIKEAEVEIKYFTADEEARYLADLRDMWESDRTTELNHATRLGLEQGKKEKQIEIAKKMLEKNKDIEEIMELTELTKEEIENLQ
ncbi:MAG: Rpn family recombination-promoting nuclease/putative transposase [Clostridia bacterium]|nr:Rpn family recombination-promoting nuclease/putative transposase [Clostridia bacterium]